MNYDVVIIGAGPAGMSAAVYASRAGLSTLMLEAGAPGGKIMKTYQIANWPGVVNTSGTELAVNMFEHSQAFGAEFANGNVTEVKNYEDHKEVVCDDGTVYTCKAVIVATGTKERLMGIPGEKEFAEKGISYCAVCDGGFFRNKEVVVIGGGNSALEESLYLANLCSKVTIVIRRDVFRADPIIVDEVMKNEKISIITKHIPYEIKGEGKVGSIVLQNVDTKELVEIETSAVFPYVGADPCTEFVQDVVMCDEHGYIMANSAMETDVHGIYGAGDCIVKTLRQVVTATSDGAVAAMSAYHYIKG